MHHSYESYEEPQAAGEQLWMTEDVTSFENHNIEEAAIASVISQLASISSLEEEQRMTLKAFLSMENMFSLFTLLA